MLFRSYLLFFFVNVSIIKSDTIHVGVTFKRKYMYMKNTIDFLQGIFVCVSVCKLNAVSITETSPY